MASELERVFEDLGMTQYLSVFVDQGFDTWETILDIQESDLDALGVKLGHRRKLQRRIANYRGIAPTVALSSSTPPVTEDPKADGVRPETSKPETNHEGSGVTKRKYRRHPKADENAPERPPSAYVLFSNKMREDLKSQNLSFTEIAKLVGENWQNLPPGEKESFETQANTAKEKYHRDLAEYKKTPEYKKYTQYLQEFKEKQAKQNPGAHESAKRPKLDSARLRHGSTSSSTTPGPQTSSGSERLQGSEPPPCRRERVNSTASMAESQQSATTPTVPSQQHGADDALSSPRAVHFESGSPREASQRHSRRPSSLRDFGRHPDQPQPQPQPQPQHLPSLSDMFEDGKMGMPVPTGSEGNPFSTGFVAANRRSVPEPANVLPGVARRAPPLRHEPSSNGSMVSNSSAGSIGRTPGEGPLPIHALLSNRSVAPPVPVATASFDQSPPPIFSGSKSPTEPPRAPFGHIMGQRGSGFHCAPTPYQLMQIEQTGDGDAMMTPAPDLMASSPREMNRNGLDGMNALLRAGEIVGRHDRD